MLAIATRDFKANNYDVKKGDIFEIEDGYVIVNKQCLSHINSIFFEGSFELIE